MNVIAFPPLRPRVAKSSARTSTRKRGKRAAPDAQEIQRRLTSPPDGFDIDPQDIVHLTEGAANTSNDNPIVIGGRAELTLRKLIARFGFERLPLTYGELHGLVQYCLDLQYYTHPCSLPEEELRRWHQSTREVLVQYCASVVPAFDLFVAGDLAGLRDLHRRERTLERLGREYGREE
jgi:hypothetical protein